MGMMLEMKCGCGYSADISIGGNRRNHTTVCMFPHFCDHCGVVNVNVLADQPCCPKCSNADIVMYGEVQHTKEFKLFGKSFPSLDRDYWTHDKRVTRPSGDNYESWSNLRLPDGDHLCPACSKMTLRLYRGGRMIFFD